jgi:hypothetical protein
MSLIASLLTGCSKHSPSATAKPEVRYLGEVELSTNAPTQVAIYTSNDCTITTSTLPDGNLSLDIAIQSQASGQKTNHIQMWVVPDQKFSFQSKASGMATPVSLMARLKTK